MNKKLKVGMIGAGRMAKFHLEVLATFPDIEICALTSRDEKEWDICKKYQISQTYKNHQEMLEKSQLDAVFVVVSVDSMFSVIKDCLNHGLPTFIEKPPGLSSVETSELLKIAKAKNVIHMIGVQRRFYSHLLYGLKSIKERGPLYSVVVEAPEHFTEIKAKKKFPDSVLAKWIFSNGIHLIDLLRFAGGKIKEVHTIKNSWKETIHPDSFHTLIQFESGTVGQYISNWSSPGGWSMKLYGDGCRVDISPMEEGTITFADKTSKKLPIDEKDQLFKPGIYAQDRMFIDACQGKRKIEYPASTLEDTLITMKLIEKILDPSLPWKTPL